MRCAGRSPPRRCATRSSARPAIPASPRRRPASRSRQRISREFSPSPGASGSTSSWSGRRRRWSPASSTGSKRLISAPSVRQKRPPRSRAPRASPRISAPDTASRPPPMAASATPPRRRPSCAGAEVVVEEFLAGEEASFFALIDGTHALPLATAQDHKRVGDGDTGPNTGGMGAYSPAPCLTPALEREVMDRIILPTIKGMAAEGRPFKGVLYAGLMLTREGPKLIEYNVRFGDPECQALMPRLMSDLLPALLAARDGVLDGFDLRWYPDSSVAVALAAKGYPGEPVKGTEISGLAEATGGDPAVKIFHAGTKRVDGRLVADGGRVLTIVAWDKELAAARDKAYAVIDRIQWPGGFCRRDIGWRVVPPRQR